jgi:N-methylhydantoinase A
VITRWLDLRYTGQVHECTIAMAPSEISESTIVEIEELFHAAHEALYTYAERDGGIPELMNLGLTALGRVPAISLPELSPSGFDASSARVGTRPVYAPEFGRMVTTAVFDGTALGAGAIIEGQAVVEEPTTTVVVPSGWWLELDRRGFYMLSST